MTGSETIVTLQAVEQKNREIYDDTSGPVWQVVIYGAVHQGHEFINLGGTRVLDDIGRLARLNTNRTVVELCAGRGAVCRYLAERYGCQVTGVEWNPNQVASARCQFARLGMPLAAKVEIVEGDCVSWMPTQPVDVVISVDSMMLLPDVAAVLRRACAMLRPGGQIFVVTIGAGDNIQEETRQFAWDIDGMASLLHRQELCDLLEACGFASPLALDITDTAIETSERIDEALHTTREALLALTDESTLRGWVEVGAHYLDAFRSRKLAYLFATAVRPNP